MERNITPGVSPTYDRAEMLDNERPNPLADLGKMMIDASKPVENPEFTAPPSSNLMSDSKIESSTEALAEGLNEAKADGKAEYTVKTGNEITGDYQKEKVSYEK